MTSPTNPLRPDQIDPLKNIQPSQEIEEGGNGDFAEMMQNPTQKMPQSIKAPSPMSILPNLNPVSGPSYDTMQSQLKVANNHLNDMQTQMQTPGLKIRPQEHATLVNHMTQASDALRSANNKLGIDSEPITSSSDGPFSKFMSLITDGSKQIATAQDQLTAMSKTPDQLNPAQMLSVQVKIGQAQQQIEFSSILLGKAVDAFKQLMNIQI